MPRRRDSLRSGDGDRFAAAFGHMRQNEHQPSTDGEEQGAPTRRAGAAGASLRTSSVDRITAADQLAQFLQHRHNDDVQEPPAAGAPPPVAAATTNNNNVTNNTHAPSRATQEARSRMNPEGMRMSSRSPSSFTSHLRENTRLILWLYEHHPQMLEETFRHELHDIDDPTIDYEPVIHPRTRYRGKKTLDERMANYRYDILKEHVKATLGPGGTRPTGPTINFDAFTVNAETFGLYIGEKKKSDDALMKPGVYQAYKSNLNHLFKRYRFQPSEEFRIDLKEIMDGVVRISNFAVQSGEVSYYHIKL